MLVETETSETLRLIWGCSAVAIGRPETGCNGFNCISDGQINTIVSNVEGCPEFSTQASPEDIRQSQLYTFSDIEIQHVSWNNERCEQQNEEEMPHHTNSAYLCARHQCGVKENRWEKRDLSDISVRFQLNSLRTVHQIDQQRGRHICHPSVPPCPNPSSLLLPTQESRDSFGTERKPGILYHAPVGPIVAPCVAFDHWSRIFRSVLHANWPLMATNLVDLQIRVSQTLEGQQQHQLQML
jgi:hypothetical protein